MRDLQHLRNYKDAVGIYTYISNNKQTYTHLQNRNLESDIKLCMKGFYTIPRRKLIFVCDSRKQAFRRPACVLTEILTVARSRDNKDLSVVLLFGGGCVSRSSTTSSQPCCCEVTVKQLNTHTIFSNTHHDTMTKCVCSLAGESGTSVSGVLRLSQSTEDSPTTIEGEIRGLTPGKHGITINVYGDLSEGAASCGAIFNPFGKSHGSPTDENCMVGDLGNVLVGADGKCVVSMSDPKVKLLGPHSVIGRSMVVYVGEDDGGKGGQDTSLTTGNTGARVGAGVIGIAAS